MAPSLAFVTTNHHCAPLLQGPTRPPPSIPFFLQHRDRPTIQCFSKTDDEEEVFLQRELARIEASLAEEQLPAHFDENDDWLLDGLEDPNAEELEEMERTFLGMQLEPKSAATLEEALRQGVVPADAGVGSGCLAGDFGFDPLEVSEKDYIGTVQRFIVKLVPGGEENTKIDDEERPSALILRDYRESEIRHGRLAMLAAFLWPLQEMLDQLLLDKEQLGPLLSGDTITLPYIPLFMTLVMLLLGYLDIYSKAIKDVEDLGEAFLPGDCFWDPLCILEGAPDSMKRNMQERELFNGRMAMLAVAVFIWEEATTRLPLISIPGNELLFEPAYQVPYIQEWLDTIFGGVAPATTDIPVNDATTDLLVDTLEQVMNSKQ